MDIKISEDIKKDTTECKKNFSCLSCERKDLCKIEKFITNNLIYIEYMNKRYCTYQMSFGSNYVCNCPVRKELYNRYKI